LAGISKELSPRTIITGGHLDYIKHCKCEFGEYVQVHEPHNNSMASCTVGALALRPTGNVQGSHYFLSLSTGKVICRARATKVPMLDDVIDRVNKLACQQQRYPQLVFGDRNQAIVDEDDIDDISHHEDQEDDNHDEDDEEYLPPPNVDDDWSDNDDDHNQDDDDENDDNDEEPHIIDEDDENDDQHQNIGYGIIDNNDGVDDQHDEDPGVDGYEEDLGVQEQDNNENA
jgi:hypothetical protein